MKLENERLSVEISEVGAEVTRIFDKKTQTDVLWEGDPAFWKRHSPILFPNVGKTYHNVVLINGTHYPTSQHGFARDGTSRPIVCVLSLRKFLATIFGVYPHLSASSRIIATVSLEILLEYALLFNTLEIVDLENPVFLAMVSNVVFMAAFVSVLHKII